VHLLCVPREENLIQKTADRQNYLWANMLDFCFAYPFPHLSLPAKSSSPNRPPVEKICLDVPPPGPDLLSSSVSPNCLSVLGPFGYIAQRRFRKMFQEALKDLCL
jgi:hypothetical protein